MAYDKNNLEKNILDVSEKLLFRYGYKNLNLNDVAREVQISKTTLYKTFTTKYDIAEKVIDRMLMSADHDMTTLFQAPLPLSDKLARGIDILAEIYAKMDREFLYDLENSLPELWRRIDNARQQRESALTALFLHAQEAGEMRNDLDPALLSAMLLGVVRSIYHPAFFLTHKVTADAVAHTVIETFLHGCATPSDATL